MEHSKKMTLVPYDDHSYAKPFQDDHSYAKSSNDAYMEDHSYSQPPRNKELLEQPTQASNQKKKNNEVDGNPKKENSIRKYALDRQRKLLTIALKLAKFGGFDDYFRIKSSDGSFLNESDVVSLLLYSCSPGRSMKGIDEFVQLLRDAEVDPELIINAQVREMLQRISHPKIRKPIYKEPQAKARQIIRAKRHTDNDEYEPEAKRIKDDVIWDDDDSDLEDGEIKD